MRKVTIKMLLPLQVLPFNSSLYFIYHELARLVVNELLNISTLNLAKVVENLALVKYKNENLYDEIVQRILQKIDMFQLETSIEKPTIPDSPLNKTKALSAIIISYALQKRNSPLFREALTKFFEEPFLKNISRLPPNYLLKTLVAIVAISSHADLDPY